MVVLNGKFDGKNIVVDYIPEDLKPNTPVQVVIESMADPTGLDAIIGILKDPDWPTDFASQFDHYTKGGPRQE